MYICFEIKPAAIAAGLLQKRGVILLNNGSTVNALDVA
jgi:hypothetical protein